MTENGTKRQWGSVLLYTFGAFLCLLAVGNLWVGSPWYMSVGILCAAAAFILGKRRIFRPSIDYTDGAIVCRYIPWWEGNNYLLCLLLPIMGVVMIAAGSNRDNPAWLRFGGIILLALTPLFVYAIIRTWRRSILRISPSALTIRLAAPGFELTEIRREQVESITFKAVPNGFGGTWPQTEVTYRPENSDGNTAETVLLGLHLTVRPINLLNALTVWKDGTDEDPDELLDRIEHILRDRSLVDV